ncbi:MAG TPA: hypothetical protein VGD45_06840 [Steroidobacter sp.]|uniref:hypothetical protein n=1 Tax=Steroidobacter sp. TaxID=1978227 RepID=UPI002ED8959C
MDNDAAAKVSQLAQAEYRWQASDTVVERLDRLTAGNCAFFVVSHRRAPQSHDPSYALLPGDEVVSESDPSAASKILDACGSQSDAGIWAEVIARFHPQAGRGKVLYDAKEARVAAERAAKSGHRVSPPAFSNNRHTVEFFSMNFETSKLYRIRATRRDDGSIAVEKLSL